jgi:DNA-binding GntR family transcriptional regulator
VVEAAPDNVTDAIRAMAAHDARLHDEIARLSGNPVLRDALSRTHVHLHVFRLHYEHGIGSQALSEHREVVREIVGGRPDGAEEAMRRHLERALARLQPMT